MRNHSPGPWEHLGQGDVVTKHQSTCAADGYTDICSVYITSDDTDYANADLIAAAPELLVALQAMLYRFGGAGDKPSVAELLAVSAIASATGGVT